MVGHPNPDPLRPYGHRLLINLPDASDGTAATEEVRRIFGEQKAAAVKIVAGSRRFKWFKNKAMTSTSPKGFRAYLPTW